MKTELKLLFMLCVLSSIFAGCSDEVTRPQIEPAPHVEPLTVDVTAASTVIQASEYARLHADVRGGVKPYQGYYWYLHDQNVGMGEDFTRQMPEQGIYTFMVVVYDSLGTSASDSITVSVVAPNIIEACVDSDLKVGPADRDDYDEVHFGQTGVGNMTVAMRFDTSERRFVVLSFHYSDGTVGYFTIPDLGVARPSCVLVDLGQARVEPTMTISMRWTGSPSKCDQWVRATQFCVSLEGPTKSADGIPIIRLGEGGNYTLVE